MGAGLTPATRRTAELRSPHGGLAATFVPAAGMLGWSLRDRGAELLGHPVGLAEYAETGEPTGIALLHPWANRLAGPEHEVAGRRVVLDLAGGGRRLRLRFLEGYRFAQVYAPPAGDFISFEPMTAPINPFESDRTVLLAPRSGYRARFDIRVEDESP